MGQIKDVKKVTVNEKTALKDQIKLEAKAARDAVAFVKQLRMQISGRFENEWLAVVSSLPSRQAPSWLDMTG
jgi:hypothetical protein